MQEAELAKLMVGVSDALDKLAAKGAPDLIRDYLVEQKLLGLKGAATACPVHAYLVRQMKTPEVRYSVRTDVVWIGEQQGMYGQMHVPNPLVVEEFIQRFDKCYYPELEVNSCVNGAVN